jgi:hypothetical protein
VKRAGVPGSYPPRIVTTVVQCCGCGGLFTHLEVMDADDEPHGVPCWLSCDECGSQLVPAADLDSAA